MCALRDGLKNEVAQGATWAATIAGGDLFNRQLNSITALNLRLHDARSTQKAVDHETSFS